MDLRIKEILQEKKMTQKDLADKINKSLRTVQIWISGAHSPNVKDLKEVAAALGVHITELFSDQPAPQNQPAAPTLRCPKCGTVLHITAEE